MLTFDVEDFINDGVVEALTKIINLLEENEVRAIFFITGHFTEKLAGFPNLTDLLKHHEIGYHSSAHSVRPAIFEYCDTEDYAQAFELSLRRETSLINPLTGEIEGIGGLTTLQQLFPKKQIMSFRAPGLCWSPAHLEALATLGIKYDFSAFLNSEPISYKEMTFYPPAQFFNPQYQLTTKLGHYLFSKIKLAVLTFHTCGFVNEKPWDSIYHNGNPKKLLTVGQLSDKQKEMRLKEFEKLLGNIRLLRKMGLKVISNPEKSDIELNPNFEVIKRCYQQSIEWPTKFFGYKPHFLYNQFAWYFNL